MDSEEAIWSPSFIIWSQRSSQARVSINQVPQGDITLAIFFEHYMLLVVTHLCWGQHQPWAKSHFGFRENSFRVIKRKILSEKFAKRYFFREKYTIFSRKFRNISPKSFRIFARARLRPQKVP